jgi:DNA-binding NtrC family response regulator
MLDFSAILQKYKKIILVDDEPGVISALSLLLKAFGFEVISFTNPNQAWDEISRNNNNLLVLSDLRMPEMTGQDLLEICKSSYPDLTFIMMSGHADEDDIQLAMDAECNAFLRKPFSPKDFHTELTKLI